MDLFPKDYKKNSSLPSANDSGSAAVSQLKNLKDKISAGGGAENTDMLLRLGSIFSALAFLLACLLWGGAFFYKKSLVGGIADLEEQQSMVFSVEDKELAAKIVDFDQGAALAQSLLENHIYSTNFFDKLSSFTVPGVQWLTLDFIKSSDSVSMKGVSLDYSNLAKQMLALEEGGFSNVKISGILLGETGGVTFSAAFNFDPKILQE